MGFKSTAWAFLFVALVCASPNWGLDGRKPGSVLIYPIQRSELGFTILSVSNSAVETATFSDQGGGTGIHWQFLNVAPGVDPMLPVDCTVVDRSQFLIPADTRSILTECFNSGGHRGFALVSAQDPAFSNTGWSHNYLIGSEIVIDRAGGVYALNAVPFESPQHRRSHTDSNDSANGFSDGMGDGDGQIDFDGIEYEGIPDELYADVFLAVEGSSLTLLSLSGGSRSVATVGLEVWNDNEYPVSTTFQFSCWFEEELANLSLVFSGEYLRLNTPHDIEEFDVNCDEVGDVETGWFRIRGLEYSSSLDSCVNPALLGSITTGFHFEGQADVAHLLWESNKHQMNGDFFELTADDSSCLESQLATTGTRARTTGNQDVAQINSVPICDAGALQMGFAGEAISFDGSNSSDSDGIIAHYDWQFGDATDVMLNAGPTPSHVYDTGGDFTVRLRVTDNEGDVTLCTTLAIVNNRPSCEAGPAQDGNAGDALTFDGSASFDLDGAIVHYDWNFGDGTPTQINAGPTPSHVFTSAGAHIVTLVVTDNLGATSQCQSLADVNALPICDAGPSLSAGVGEIVNFDGSNSIDPDGVVVQYDWNFGDGSATLENAGPMPSHQYSSTGQFTVTLRITDDAGATAFCTGLVLVNLSPLCNAGPSLAGNIGDAIVFDGSGSLDPDGTIVQYDWEFGDGGGVLIGGGATPAHVYLSAGTFTVTLLVTDNDGAQTACTTTVLVNQAPVCEAGADQFGAVGDAINFNGSGSSDADGVIVAYDWTFGDGSGVQLDVGPTPSHVYTNPGNYGVLLTVTDNFGAQSTCSTQARINASPICFAGPPKVGTVGEVLSFDGSASIDPDGQVVNYAWNFGDGSMVESGPPGTHASRTHSFFAGGTYTVTLTVTDNDGAQSTCTTDVVINQEPLCDSGGPYMQSLFVAVDFDGSASSDPAGSIVNYAWGFGDGSPALIGPPGTHAAVSHAYTNYGVFTAELTVTNNVGASKTCDALVEIRPVSGALVFAGDDAEQHCIGSGCGGYATSLFNWTLANSNNGMDTTAGNGDGILAVGVQPTVVAGPGAFFSFADLALSSWIALLPDPGLSVDIITDPIDLMNVDFNDYQLVYIPSFGGVDAKELVEQHVLGGIRQELLDVLFARKANLEEYSLRRGGSLLSFTQAEDVSFDPQIMNAYTWSPIPFGSESFRFANVTLTAFATNPGGPLEGLVAAQITHEGWHNIFLPDPMSGLSGLGVIAKSDEPPVAGEAAIIGGIPTPPIGARPSDLLPLCDAGPPSSSNVGDFLLFDGSASLDPDGVIVSYDWQWGDGSPDDLDAGAMPGHVYVTGGPFVVTLTVTDDDGGVALCSTIVTVNQFPICHAGPSLSGGIGDALVFDGSASIDPDGSIVTFDWDFGDGSALALSAGPTPSHIYANPGTYTATLTVTDDDLAQTQCTTTIEVNGPPICDAGLPVSGNAGDTLSFDGSASSDSDGVIVSYDWDFGDGSGIQINAGPTPSHVFVAAGVYTVTLRVTDDDGSQSLCNTTTDVNVFPSCDAGPMQSGEMGAFQFFDGSGSFDADGTIVSYDWNFGDGSGQFDAGPNPAHAFSSAGEFTVTLTVTDNDGAQSLCSTQAFVNSMPVCDAGGPYTESLFQAVFLDGSASFDRDGTIVQYDWDYGDGSPPDMDAGPVPGHVYTNYGTYVVELTVTDDVGSTSTCDSVVNILPVSGALVFAGDDADDHCLATACGSYASSLIQWTLDNSHSSGNGILAVGLQPTTLPSFISIAEVAFDSWLALLSNPAIPVTRVSDPIAFMSMDFNDYELIYIPSYGGKGNFAAEEFHVGGGISQEMLDALFVRKADLEEFVLRRGGSLLAFTQAEDDDFTPQIANAYTWSPIPFTSEPFRFFNVQLTNFASNGDPGPPIISAPLPGVTSASIPHELWHNTFKPDPVFDLSGLKVIAEGDEVGVFGKFAIIGGVPTPPIPSTRGTNGDYTKDADLIGIRAASSPQELVSGSR